MNVNKWFEKCLYIGDNWYYTQSSEYGVVFYRRTEDGKFIRHDIPEGYAANLVVFGDLLLLLKVTEKPIMLSMLEQHHLTFNLYDSVSRSVLSDNPLHMVVQVRENSQMCVSFLNECGVPFTYRILDGNKPGFCVGYNNMVSLLMENRYLDADYTAKFKCCY